MTHFDATQHQVEVFDLQARVTTLETTLARVIKERDQTRERLEEAHAAGRTERQAEIVAWLRSDCIGGPADVWGRAMAGSEWSTAADAIERGVK
jgi:hypothetical protein